MQEGTTGNLLLRGMDKGAWRELRAESVRRGITIAEALRLAIMAWLSCERRGTES